MPPKSKTKKNTKKPVPKKTRKKSKTKTKSILRSFLKYCIILFLILALAVVAIIAGAFYYHSKQIPPIFAYTDYKPKQLSVIYDDSGNPLLELYDEKRTLVPFENIAQHMKDAMIASEDAEFYKHKGIDYLGILRSVYNNIKRGTSQGASTITQQVVKNLLLSPEKSYTRKIQEALLAKQLDQYLTKDEILTIYLNHVYFGHRVYGIQEAAKFYFNKNADELDLNQAATLAGLVQSPERLSPKKHPVAAKNRRDYVLRQMRNKNFINEDLYRTTLDIPIKTYNEKTSSLGKAPYFTAHVRQILTDKYGAEYLLTSGLHIHTTLNLKTQQLAENALHNGLYAVDERRYLNRPLKNPTKKPLPGILKKETNYEATVLKIEENTVIFAIADKNLPYTPTKRQLKNQPINEVYQPGQTWFVQITELSPDNKPLKINIPDGPDGSLIAIEPETGNVVALVGGYDFRLSNFNRATQAKRQTGSSFKTFVYAAAIDASVITPATVIDDAPKVFHIPGKKEPWSPQNADRKFKGPISARTALALSRNTVAVDVLERVGIKTVIEFVKKLGVTSELVDNFTLAL